MISSTNIIIKIAVDIMIIIVIIMIALTQVSNSSRPGGFHSSGGLAIALSLSQSSFSIDLKQVVM